MKEDLIPYNPNPVFLGIIFDESLSFNSHFNNLKSRAQSRLNIIKIFSHKSWHLSRETLINIYNALIGSIFSYSFFTVANVSNFNIEKLQIIQNKAIRSIFKLDWNSLNHLLVSISGISPIKHRFAL